MKKHLVFLALLFLITLVSCESEPIGDANINYNLVDEQLFTYLERITNDDLGAETINCIEFNYSFTLFIFDSEDNFLNAQVVFNNIDFIALLGSLGEDQSISINYPISGTLSNGELVEVNSNEELKEAIEACSNEERRRRCNNTLTDCTWTVQPVIGTENLFEGATYVLKRNGTAQLHQYGTTFFGSWVTLYIGDDLYLNIDFFEGTEIQDFWNHNWLVETFNNSEISIHRDDASVKLMKDCSIPCEATGYEVCENEGTPGIATFTLEKYTTCIPVSPTHDLVSNVRYSFYETEEDAFLGTNPISGTLYNNLENPQIIYARIVYDATNELLNVQPFTINAVFCSGG